MTFQQIVKSSIWVSVKFLLHSQTYRLEILFHVVSCNHLGSGNGMMLVELYREGYTNLTGVDYSANAIELAAQIAADQNMNITYTVLDLLSADEIKQKFGDKQFDVVHDKGTYDAISLHPENPAEKRVMYIENLYNLASSSGLLILSSCNWTEAELCTSLSGKFEPYKKIPTPTFKFGGSVGSVVTQIVFKKCTATD